MAEGLAVATANALLNAMCNGTAYSIVQLYGKLHVGAPGAAGTAFAAANTERKSVSFAVAAGGAISNDAEALWTNVPVVEDYTHMSFWDAAAAGNFVFSGTITANAVGVGDDFRLPVGDVDVNFLVAS